MSTLTGKGFEDLLAAIFCTLGFTVQTTPATGDYGVDLLLIDEHEVRVAVQAKRHNSDVGISAVQELYAGMAHYDCDQGILAVATRLTPQAKQLLSKLPRVSLLSGQQVVQLAERTLSGVLILTSEAAKSVVSETT